MYHPVLLATRTIDRKRLLFPFLRKGLEKTLTACMFELSGLTARHVRFCILLTILEGYLILSNPCKESSEESNEAVASKSFWQEKNTYKSKTKTLYTTLVTCVRIRRVVRNIQPVVVLLSHALVLTWSTHRVDCLLRVWQPLDDNTACSMANKGAWCTSSRCYVRKVGSVYAYQEVE
jgi:hypothetical protein